MFTSVIRSNALRSASVAAICALWMPVAEAWPAQPAGDADARFNQHRDAMYRAHEARQYATALEHAEAMLKLRPDDATTMYNLACIHCLLGRKEQAYEWLDKSLAAGLSDANLVANDPDFESIRGEERFHAVLRRLRGERVPPRTTQPAQPAPRREAPPSARAAEPAQRRDSTAPAEAARLTRAADGTVTRLPRGYSAEKRLPLVLALHGDGGSPRRMAEAWAAAADEAGCIVVAPQGGSRITAETFFWQLDEATCRAAIGAVESAARRLSADGGRMVVAGVGQGGRLAYRLIAANPERFCGAVIAAADFDASLLGGLNPGSLSGLRAFVMVGEYSDVRTRDASRAAVAALEAAGAKVRLHVCKGVGNGLPADATADLSAALAYVLGL